MTGLGWVLAAAFAAAWAAQRRVGDFEVWKGHAHLYSNRRLDAARREVARLGPGARVVLRRGGRVLAEVGAS